MDLNEMLGIDLENNVYDRQAKSLSDARDKLVADLIAARRKQNMTQKHVAKQMGVTQSTVSQFERTRGSYRIDTVQRYAMVVGVHLQITVDWFEDLGPDEGE